MWKKVISIKREKKKGNKEEKVIFLDMEVWGNDNKMKGSDNFENSFVNLKNKIK